MKSAGARRVCICLLMFVCGRLWAAPQGSAFTYQGSLAQAGVPVNGLCDFQFSLWDAANGGNQIGTTQTVAGTLVSNGLFGVALDFGAAAFNGDARWLQIAARAPAGQGAFTTLAPRQTLNSTPYALRAADAATVTGTVTNATLAGITTVEYLEASGPVTVAGNLAAQTVSGSIQASNLVYWQAVPFTNTLVFTRFTNGLDYSGAPLDLTILNGFFQWTGNSYAGSNGVGFYYDPLSGAVYGTNAAHHAVPIGDYLVDNCAGGCGSLFIGGPILWEDPLGEALSGTSSWLTNLVSTNAVVALPGQGQVLGMTAASALTAQSANSLASAQPGSNAIQNATLLGSNALANFSLSDYSADQALWYKLAVGSLAGASNVNRFAYKTALGKIQSNRTLSVMFYANGWVLDGLLDSVFANLTNNLPVAGYQAIPRFGGLGAQNWQNGAQLVNGITGISDPYWLTWYQQLSNVNASVDFINNGVSSGQLFDSYQLDYVTAPDGGIFKVQTNINGGPWTDLYTGVSSASATTNGTWLRWRSPAPCNTAVRVIATAVGVNRILYTDAVNSAITNGFVITTLGRQGEDFVFYNSFPPNLQGPLLQSWNPDLILMPMWGMATDAPNFVMLYRNVFQSFVPNAGVVICGQWPRSPLDEANGAALARPALRAACRQLDASYFDGFLPFGSYSEMVARGFFSVDGTHLSPAGNSAYGQLLFQWLGLFDSGPAVVQPLFSLTTNDFVLNTTYTNGSRPAQVSACFALSSTAPNAARVGLYLDQNASGSWSQTGLGVQRGAGAVLSDIYRLSAFVQPGARFVFTNLSAGAATAAVVPDSCQWVSY